MSDFRPQTKDQLHGFVAMAFGVQLPHKIFTIGNSCPLDFVAEAFFNQSHDVAAWACRSGGKTLGASIIAALEYLYTDNLQGRVLSGSEDQARNLYGYWAQWCNGVLAPRLTGNVKRHLTEIGGGRFEILAASQKRVRGPKVQRLYEDELDEIDIDVDAASVGMIDSKPGMPGRTIYASTWHRADGLMAQLVSKCPDNGVSLHRWNLWESIEQCPPERHNGGKGCDQCPLASVCVEKAQEYHTDPERRLGIAAETCGLYKIDDAIKAFLKVGAANWDAEYLCNRPSVAGLVFPEFDERTHKCEHPPADLIIYRTIDWGHGVFVCLWIGEDKNGVNYILDTYRAENGTVPQHAKYINAHRLQNIRDTYCDPAGRNRNDQTGRSDIDQFKTAGIPCTFTLAPRLRDVSNGIQMVRALIRPATGPPKLLYVPNENNRAFVQSIQSYRNRRVNGIWIDQPQDPQEFEHVADATRYYTINRQAPRGVGVVRVGAS